MSEIKPNELGMPSEEVFNFVPTGNKKRITFGEEPEDNGEEVEKPIGDIVSVRSSTTDSLNVIEYSTIPEKTVSYTHLTLPTIYSV